MLMLVGVEVFDMMATVPLVLVTLIDAGISVRPAGTDSRTSKSNAVAVLAPVCWMVSV